MRDLEILLLEDGGHLGLKMLLHVILVDLHFDVGILLAGLEIVKKIFLVINLLVELRQNLLDHAHHFDCPNQMPDTPHLFNELKRLQTTL